MLLQDLRYGLRLLLRQPGFTAVAVLTLALGIGANTAIFSIVNTVLLQPLPYAQPDRLLTVHESDRTFREMSVAYPNFQDWVQMNRSFEALAARRNDDFILAGGGRSQEPEHLPGMMVTANFFSTLGLPLLAGPGFSPNADRAGGAAQVVVSYGLWQRRFGGDPHLVGQVIPLNGKSYTVVGIAPRDFWFPNSNPGAAVFTLLGQYLPVELDNRGTHPGIMGIARLRPGVSLASARTDLASVAATLARRYPKEDGDAGVTLLPFHADIVQSVQSTLLLLMGAVGLVLLIACANVANLLLARATGRRRELAVRAAVGASSGRIVQQLLTESLLLALAGAAGGLLLAWLGVRSAPALLPGDLPRVQAVAISGTVFGFTLAAAVLSGVLFGMIPAWHSRRLDLQDALKEGGRTGSAARHRSQSVLVMAEVALSLILLAGAGLLIRSILRLNQVAPGFNPNHLAVMGVAVSPASFSSGGAVAAAHLALLQRVNAVPGVEAAAETSLVPLGRNDSESGFWIGGPNQPPPSQMQEAMSFITSPEYLKAMQTPLLRGRFFTPDDDRQHPFVVVIDDVLAKREFPGQDPVGRQMQFGPPFGAGTIIGVVGHVKFWGLSDDDTAKIRNQMYWSINQIPMQYMTLAGTALSLVVRTAGDPAAVLPGVRAAVAGPERDQPVYNVETMDQVIGASLAGQRFLMSLLGLFALIAIVLAAIGIYGVLSYSVAQRTHEVGIRMALGAAPGDVVRQIVRQGASLAAIGAGVGLAGALFATQLLRSDLYGVTPRDPVTLGGAALLLLALALLASYIPARRAARVDPVVALRAE